MTLGAIIFTTNGRICRIDNEIDGVSCADFDAYGLDKQQVSLTRRLTDSGKEQPMTNLATAPRSTTNRADDYALDLIFREARTHYAWMDEPVSDELLQEVYELTKWGPTGANAQPLRIVFVKSAEAKERLLPAMMPGNQEKTRTAPVNAILAYDSEFYNELPRLFPHMDAKPIFENNPELSEKSAILNSALQGAYFILAARSLGLDCGPMAGFDAGKVNEEFFSDSPWRALFVCNLGYGSGENQFPRGPRLDFEEATRTL